MSKIQDSIDLIRAKAEKAAKPAALLSFGKDSMAMATLIRVALHGGLKGPRHFPLTHAFPVPVIYYRDPWFPQKHEFAEHVIESWSMEVHDYPPFLAGVKVNNERLELVARYNFGAREIDMPKNVVAPEIYPRRDYICGLSDWLLRPKCVRTTFEWNCVFIGHKSADVDPFEGPVPLKVDSLNIGGVEVVFPLRHWSDEDVWTYIEQMSIPVQRSRYHDRREIEDLWYNNDYVHACTACIDPRETAQEVFCPKLKRNVPNRGAEVLKLQGVPEYIGKEEEVVT
jgi:hypothetical protein